MFLRVGTVSVVLLAFAGSLAAQQQQFAELGDVALVQGGVLKNCRIGYRTFGTLNADKSNVVLFPTWAAGKSEQFAGTVGPGKWLELPGHYVIVVDALANGVSSSPSNSAEQPRMHFPRITIRDMVETQHRLLTEVLHIQHVKAVMGISMGGMQTFQWMVAYPGFMDRATPIVGSPQLAPYDLMLWQTRIDAIKNHRNWNDGNYTVNPTSLIDAEFGALTGSTPEAYNAKTTREQVQQQLAEARTKPTMDANDKIRQMEAMMSLDVADGGSLEDAARKVKAKVLVIPSLHDHVVTPGPALRFAELLRAQTLVLENNCGHGAPNCDQAKVGEAVRAFLR